MIKLTPYGQILAQIAAENADIARRQGWKDDPPDGAPTEDGPASEAG